MRYLVGGIGGAATLLGTAFLAIDLLFSGTAPTAISFVLLIAGGATVLVAAAKVLKDVFAETLSSMTAKRSRGRHIRLSWLTATQVDRLVAAKSDLPYWDIDARGATLSPEVAEALAKYEGVLSLDGLTILSTRAAEALAQHKGDLRLDDLTTLSDEAARALSLHKGDALGLAGLTTLSPQAAKSLSLHDGWLSLDGLTTLSDEAAKALAVHNGGLSLNGLTTLSDEVAKALALNKGWLSFNGVAVLSDEAAKALAIHDGRLSLDGLTTLSDEAAKALAVHNGRLTLNGLTTLSDEAARALAVHNGGLSLDGLTTLSDEAAKAFALNNGWLSLNGMVVLSDRAAEALARHAGGLSLEGLTSLHSVPLATRWVKEAEDDWKAPDIYFDPGLNRLTVISPEVAATLAKSTFDLRLTGLKSPSAAVVAALRTKRSVWVGRGWSAWWFEVWRRASIPTRIWRIALVVCYCLGITLGCLWLLGRPSPEWFTARAFVGSVGVLACLSPLGLLSIHGEGYYLFRDRQYRAADAAHLFAALNPVVLSVALLQFIIIGHLSSWVFGFWPGILTALIFAGIYILPSVIAAVRNHPNKVPIILLNYLAGWMFIPWIVALVWSSLALNRNDA